MGKKKRDGGRRAENNHQKEDGGELIHMNQYVNIFLYT